MKVDDFIFELRKGNKILNETKIQITTKSLEDLLRYAFNKGIEEGKEQQIKFQKVLEQLRPKDKSTEFMEKFFDSKLT